MRRTDSEIHEQIEGLISAESDPRDRAMLLILYRLATLLIDNVQTTREISDESERRYKAYDAHMVREEAYINQGRGMWKVLGTVLILAQSALGYLYYEHVQAVRDIHATVTMLGKEMEMVKERTVQFERLGRQP